MRKAKSRLKTTQKKKKAQKRRLETLRKYFRVIPVNHFKGYSFNIFLEK